MKEHSESKDPKEINQKLKEKFEEIKRNHNRCQQKKLAELVLGSSVIRVFEKDTKGDLKPILEKIDIEDLLKCESQEDYRNWFEEHLSKIAEGIKLKNTTDGKIGAGYKWGYAAKILNLFVRDLVESKHFFPKEESAKAAKIEYWLYIPIDSKVIKELKKSGVELPFSKIKEIDNKEKFYEVQNLLGRIAEEVRVPRIWFDDIWIDN